jgi:hypothetical protein
MMTRSCSVCGGSKSGKEAELKWDVPVGHSGHNDLWDKIHLPGCKYAAMSPSQKVDNFMENGSPVSSIDE